MAETELICLFLGPPSSVAQWVFNSLHNVDWLLPFPIEWTMLETVSRYGELLSSASESMYRSLEKADLIIADITDGHPNVMYELGFAHALKKPVLPIVEKGAAQIPTDLRGYLYFTYETGDEHSLIKVVSEWIKRNHYSKKEI